MYMEEKNGSKLLQKLETDGTLAYRKLLDAKRVIGSFGGLFVGGWCDGATGVCEKQPTGSNKLAAWNHKLPLEKQYSDIIDKFRGKSSEPGYYTAIILRELKKKIDDKWKEIINMKEELKNLSKDETDRGEVKRKELIEKIAKAYGVDFPYNIENVQYTMQDFKNALTNKVLQEEREYEAARHKAERKRHKAERKRHYRGGGVPVSWSKGRKPRRRKSKKRKSKKSKSRRRKLRRPKSKKRKPRRRKRRSRKK